MNIKIDSCYHYRQNGLFEGIVKVTDISNTLGFSGDQIAVFSNLGNWRTNGLALGGEYFIKEVTPETNPEYFL